MKVLFPLDGSERAFKAMEKALEVLHGSQVQATLLVVMQDFTGAPEDIVRQFEDDTEDEVFPNEQSALVVLKQATKRMRRKGLEMKLKMAQGNIVRNVIEESRGHDLLVMHSKRAAGFQLRSSRTKQIIRGAQCNILLMQEF